MARFATQLKTRPASPAMLIVREPAAADTDPGCGPGWYESSLDLRFGLDVREGLPPDAALDEWLGACLLC